MKNGKIKAGIIGGAGYTAGELIRILVNHPDVEISFVHSESNAGNFLYDVHEGLVGDTEQIFCSEYDLESVDVLFMCGAHGKSGEFWQSNSRPGSLKVIDLAQDYRDQSEGYVYGLPEWQMSRIAAADKLANPGCFATAIQLALLPLAASGLLQGDVQVTAITGSTGAGAKPGAMTHFSWRNNNISTYKVFGHQHLDEITRNLGDIQSFAPCSAETSLNAGFRINFVPVRGDFARGIFASLYTRCDLTGEQAAELYKTYYAEAAFTHVYDKAVDLKQVVNTNKCLVHVEKHADQLVVSSVIDNLLKGASGQAVQNMNIMFGLDEKTGLNLKASAF